MEATNSDEIPQWSRHLTIGLLLAATLGVAIMSEIISNVVEQTLENLGQEVLCERLVTAPC
ncbi:MAG: hypothetical protein LUQ38_10540 [Methanotrichaceae archaeon]|nr:hypothetical protein [Methanotrichaceae archaeon]MDD1757414.1 hypothetical protein [Methanotrichaceae archaeon]